jgi:hypothetical protein
MLTPDLKPRVLAAVAFEWSPPRRARRQRSLVRAIGALAVPIAFFAAVGGVRADARPLWLVATTALGGLAIATATLFVAARRGSSMLGRSQRQLLGIAVTVPLLIGLWKIGVSSALPEMMGPWPGRPGLRCFGLTVLLAAWPVAVLLRELAASDPIHPRALGASLGVAAGAGAAVLVDLWCPVAHVPHVLLGHITPILMLGGFGCVIGELVLGIRSRR